eukprot:Skav215934  [mRNA]  locus=scaffold226:430960:439598:+ [translate_table: standard]
MSGNKAWPPYEPRTGAAWALGLRYCTSSGPSTNLSCLHCGAHYCPFGAIRSRRTAEPSGGGACLHGDAGKMQSLIKCAGCGKKPGVKTNGHRNSWNLGSQTAVCNAPCNERGGPRYDMDDGAANSAFTSGLRASGAQDEAARRCRADSVGMRGPERFFYDRRRANAANMSTYTGTHSNGGPEHVAKGRAGSRPDGSWKRPSTELNVDDLGHLTLLSNQAGSGAPRPGSPSCLPDVMAAQLFQDRPSSARPSSRGAGSRMVGPERFFYDRSTYTGTHTRGGPSSVAKGGGTSFDQTWKRPAAQLQGRIAG